MNYTYIVKCADSTLYTGWTNDLDKRIKAHNSGKGAKYTKTRRPVKLVYYEEHETKNEAMSREYAIKHLTRKEKEILIKGNGNLCGSWMVKEDLIKAGKMESSVEFPLKRYVVVNIGFFNNEDAEEETQLTLGHDPLTKEGIKELKELFTSLANEFDTKPNRVTYIHIVATAQTDKELEAMGY